MGRRKKKKLIDTTEYNHILYGVLLILVSIIGYGQFGIVGKLIAIGSVFLVGILYHILLILMLLTGIYLILKLPSKFYKRISGLYLVFISALILININYYNNLDEKGISVLLEMLGQVPNLKEVSGGGFIGTLFTVVFIPLFDTIGTQIIAWILMAIGIFLVAGNIIIAVLNHYRSKLKLPTKETKVAIEKAEQKFEQDSKIIISSVDDLKHYEEKETKEEEKEEFETNKGYRKPMLSLLEKPEIANNKENHEYVKNNISALERVFKDFDIVGKIVAVNIGPSVTQYEVELKAGTKVSKILSIHREISLALTAKGVRIQAPIPGKGTVGIELPNKIPTYVSLREILEKAPKELQHNKLLVALGKDIMGNPIYCEINKTPHLLVAGATGSGKSVCTNSIIISILMRARPDEVKLVLIDPKKVELNVYNGIPHLLIPVVADAKKATVALRKIVAEMDRRYEVFNETGTKNIAGYNVYLEKQNKNKDEKIAKMPYIVVVIDELADLMVVSAREVEDSIMRITQIARAAGIHLIVATQRPSTDVITGLIKSNIPSRISFAVSSSIDSRTILDMSGAEKLLGNGDMLFLPMGENVPLRLQGTFVSEKEIKTVVDYTITQQKANYDESLLIEDEELKAKDLLHEEDYEDPIYDQIVEFVIKEQKASASLLQRRFRLGYNRAARVIDLLEERGIVGPSRGSKPRDVLVKFEEK